MVNELVILIDERPIQKIMKILSNPNNLNPRVIKPGGESAKVNLTDEEGAQKEYNRFVVFPLELTKVFPGSYVSPQDFLDELGIHDEVDKKATDILSAKLCSKDDLTLKVTGENFGLKVFHGATNKHTLQMSSLAKQGFEDSKNRAQYQNAMAHELKPMLEGKKDLNYSVRIFDDCLATGDSIAGYLSYLLDEDPQALAGGVEVDLTAATVQGILFLKAFAEAHNFKLQINVGHLAFGLSQGIINKENDTRQHANYITYPPEIVKMLQDSVQRQLAAAKFEDGNIYVVGDMGEAEQGIERWEMESIRREVGAENGGADGSNYCSWNETRQDPHGYHFNRQERLTLLDLAGGRPTDVYLARGGYLPYALDNKHNPNFDKTNKVVLAASRVWSQEHGYGVGITNL